MFRGFAIAFASLLLGIAAVPGAPSLPPMPSDFGTLHDQSIKKWTGAELVLTGKIEKVAPGPIALSRPPTYTFRLHISPDKFLSGFAKFDKQLIASFSARQEKAPTFPPSDQECLFALKFVRNAWVLQSIDEASADNVEQARLASMLPLGWTIKDGKLISPWVTVGRPGKAVGMACSVTGRPVLLAGPGVKFSVEPVPPVKMVEFGNPDGDGEFKLIVKNETDRQLEVPALLTDGRRIHWKECVVIRCQDKTYPIPGSAGNVVGLKPVVLKAGESFSGNVNVFTLDGPAWPIGGDRLDFQFCLGEKSAVHSFYYHSRTHDAVRNAVQRALKNRFIGTAPNGPGKNEGTGERID
jgi:hypothetical protein